MKRRFPKRRATTAKKKAPKGLIEFQERLRKEARETGQPAMLLVVGNSTRGVDPEIDSLIAQDKRYFASKPEIRWFLRPAVPGEFNELDIPEVMDLSDVTYALVQRTGHGTNMDQMRYALTEEMAMNFVRSIEADGKDVRPSARMGDLYRFDEEDEEERGAV